MSIFPSVVSFRPILENGEEDNPIPLYRSGRMDDITPEDFQRYKQLGIRTVLDLRDSGEVSKFANSPRLIHQNSSIATVVYPRGDYEESDEVNLQHLPNTPMKGSVDVSAGEDSANIGDDGLTRPGRYDTSSTPTYIFVPVLNFQCAKTIISEVTRGMVATWKRYAALAWTGLLNSVWKDTGYSGTYQDTVMASDTTQDVNLRVIANTNIICNSSKAFVAALKLLTEKENLPAVFCCSAGKERTGLLAALVFHILGESEQTMEKEQVKCAEDSNKLYGIYIMKYPQYAGVLRRMCDYKEGDISETLTYIRNTYGSVDSFLDEKGFGANQRERLRKILLGKE